MDLQKFLIPLGNPLMEFLNCFLATLHALRNRYSSATSKQTEARATGPIRMTRGDRGTGPAARATPGPAARAPGPRSQGHGPNRDDPG